MARPIISIIASNPNNGQVFYTATVNDDNTVFAQSRNQATPLTVNNGTAYGSREEALDSALEEVRNNIAVGDLGDPAP